ncbi:hypothetical protein E2320_004414, partial [Naja naja]
YRYKKDELFKRLKVSTFAQLVCDAAPAENNLEIAETNGKGSPEEKPASPILFINNTGAGESYRSTLQRPPQPRIFRPGLQSRRREEQPEPAQRQPGHGAPDHPLPQQQQPAEQALAV